jgi:hypothetical protein
MDIRSTKNKTQTNALIIAALCFLIFGGFFLAFWLTNDGWAIFNVVGFSFFLLLAVIFLLYGLLLTGNAYDEQMRDRRTAIRNYLRAENERYYHKRLVHWKPSRECSFLVLRAGYNPELEDEECWVTGRDRPDVLPWG